MTTKLTPLACEEAQEFAALAELDVLEARLRADLARHLDTCVTCPPVVIELRAAVGALGYGAPQASPRPELKTRLMAGLDAGTTAALSRPVAPPPLPRGKGSAPGWWPGLVACSVALALGLGASLLSLNNTRRELAQAREAIAAEKALVTQLTADMSQVKVQNVSLSDSMDVIRSHDVKVVPMAGMAGQATATGAQAKVFWSPAKRAWLVTFTGMPAAGAGKTYQLWAVTPDAKMSMGTFSTDEQGAAMLKATLPAGGKPMAAAVSLEPVGGMPQPTGPIVMLGPIKDL